MKVRLWGTRGSLASPGPDTARYGGNTSCVALQGSDGTLVVLDAGTGIRRLGLALPPDIRKLHVLLTHLHMDHIQGMAFFRPLRTPGVEVHVWGPASTTQSLKARLMRYLSPPLFPVHLRDLGSTMMLHEVPSKDFDIGEFRVSSALVCHPDTTVGYRVASDGATVAYLPDHEPALGARQFPLDAAWTSGYSVAAGADLLIHDAQYTSEEYAGRIGVGHSSLAHTFAFAKLTEAKHLVPFHHDPAHSDDDLDRMFARAMDAAHPEFAVTPGTEDSTFDVGSA